MKSMTGYGRADFLLDGEGFSIEIKSLNHRFLEIDMKLPERFSTLEMKIRDEIRHVFSRGSFKVYIRSSDRNTSDINASIDTAKKYLDEIEKIKASLNLSGNIGIEMLINFKDIFAGSGKISDSEKDWKALKQALNQAAQDILKMREDEGGELSRDVSNRLDAIERLNINIEGLSKRAADAYKEKLKERVSTFLKDAAIDEARLLNEVAIFSDRCCIDEEIVRLRSHLTLFKTFFDSQEPVGRKMDFLCQEILRELNTMASKSVDAEIAHIVVEAKAELEKIREQVQNIE